MPPKRERVTKYVLVFWTDCPKPCSDVVHEDKIEADPNFENLEEGQERQVKRGKKLINKGRIVKRGMNLYFFFPSVFTCQ